MEKTQIQKTHFKKNLDSRYISGEDLQAELNGLKKEQVVVIDKFEDSETFDQNSQTKAVKTGFFLKTLDGKPVYKPVILNNTNAKFCRKEFGSDYMEDWIGKPFVLYAQPDKRFNFVARFKKYYPPQISDVVAIKLLNTSTNQEELKANWQQLSAQEKNLPTVIKTKEELKAKL
jgi:hypothetical protein